MTRRIDDVDRFFHALGRMHDARMLQVSWQPCDSAVSISVNDLCSNFRGLPGYLGPIAGGVVMEAVELVELRVETLDVNCNIYDVEIKRLGRAQWHLVWKIAPTGTLGVRCGIVSVECDNFGRLPAQARETLIE
jgi:hypothetical protein